MSARYTKDRLEEKVWCWEVRSLRVSPQGKRVALHLEAEVSPRDPWEVYKSDLSLALMSLDFISNLISGRAPAVLVSLSRAVRLTHSEMSRI